jgi:hypothetical protein
MGRADAHHLESRGCGKLKVGSGWKLVKPKVARTARTNRKDQAPLWVEYSRALTTPAMCCPSDEAAQPGLTYVDEGKEIFFPVGATDAIIRSRCTQSGFHIWLLPEASDRTCRSLRESVVAGDRDIQDS